MTKASATEKTAMLLTSPKSLAPSQDLADRTSTDANRCMASLSRFTCLHEGTAGIRETNQDAATTSQPATPQPSLGVELLAVVSDAGLEAIGSVSF